MGGNVEHARPFDRRDEERLVPEITDKLMRERMDAKEALARLALAQAGGDINRVVLLEKPDYAHGKWEWRFEVTDEPGVSDELAILRAELEEANEKIVGYKARLARVQTHSTECWRWHIDCCVYRAGKLEKDRDALQAKLAEAERQRYIAVHAPRAGEGGSDE